MSDPTKSQSPCDTLRFTPLYVTRMFIEMCYYLNKNLIIPEALLECGPTFESSLLQDLEEINTVANSGDTVKIIQCLRYSYVLSKRFKIRRRYDDLCRALYHFFGTHSHVCENVNDFLFHMNAPNIINCDIIKELVPIRLSIMFGDYDWQSVFDCIFRYILYIKTKHLGLIETNELNFMPCIGELSNLGINKMGHDFIFNY